MPKPLRWLRAKLGGYFWLPCPICGRKFGGFEAGDGTAEVPGQATHKVTCPRCPGQWIWVDHRWYQPRARFDEDGKPYLVLTAPLTRRTA